MKKQIITTLILILISLSKSQDDTTDIFVKQCIEAGNKEGNIEKTQCTSISMDYDLKCCYVQYELENLIGIKSCVPIYDSLSSIKGYAKMLKDAKKVSVKCGSQYLMMSFIGFFAWFILF